MILKTIKILLLAVLMIGTVLLLPQFALVYFNLNILSLMILCGAVSWVIIAAFIIPLIERMVSK